MGALKNGLFAQTRRYAQILSSEYQLYACSKIFHMP
jgi:hypothetical protein